MLQLDMASTIVCRASSPQLGSCLFTMEDTAYSTLSQPEHVSSGSELRLRRAKYLDASRRSRIKKKVA